MAGIYIHIPFCKTKCYYCDFYSVAGTLRKNDFIGALKKEINSQKSYLSGSHVETIYFGGGTPSMLSCNEIQEIINEIERNFRLTDTIEITLEANPDDLTEEYISALRATPINRLSIGVQSFSDSDLKLLNRRHTGVCAEMAVRNAVAAGFRNISVDLIYGIPGMSLQTWRENIEKVVLLGAVHISAYHLTIEENTVLSRFQKSGKFMPVSESDSLKHYEILAGTLLANNFVHYEISNFAKNEMYSRHNTSYWQNKKYLGLGPSAHSYNLSSRQWNISNIQKYINSIAAEKPYFETELLSTESLYNDYILTSLRTMWGADLSVISDRFGNTFFSYFTKILKKYSHSDLVIINGENIRLSGSGFFLSDRIIEDFIYS